MATGKRKCNCHLETLYETSSLQDEQLYNELTQKVDLLGKKLNNFLTAVQKHHSNYQNDAVNKKP